MLLQYRLIVFLLLSYFFKGYSQKVAVQDSFALNVPKNTTFFLNSITANKDNIYVIHKDFTIGRYDWKGTLIQIFNDFGKNIFPISVSCNATNVLVFTTDKQFHVYDSQFLNKQCFAPIKEKLSPFPVSYTSKLYYKPNAFLSQLGFYYEPTKYNKYTRHKKTNNLLGEFEINTDNTLTLKQMVGIRDTIYKRKFIPYLENIYFDVDYKRQRLIIGQEASHSIQVWDLNNYKLLNNFGVKGKNINPIYDTPQSWNKKIDNNPRLNYLPEITKRIECTVYQDVFYDLNKGYYYRVYRVGKKDTVRHNVMTIKEWKKLKRTSKNTCLTISNEIELHQTLLEQSKLYGLQSYNEKHELIFDEVMPTPFNILKIENDEIWVHGKYDEATQKYWIYKYKIELPKP
jgi:hypothetical protein